MARRGRRPQLAAAVLELAKRLQSVAGVLYVHQAPREPRRRGWGHSVGRGDVYLEETGRGEEPAIDVVCRTCGCRCSLIPEESVVLQALAFLDHHRHSGTGWRRRVRRPIAFQVLRLAGLLDEDVTRHAS
jgi:hypothetical protein